MTDTVRVTLLTERLRLEMPEPHSAPQVVEYLKRNQARFADVSPLVRDSRPIVERVSTELASAITENANEFGIRFYIFNLLATSDVPIGDIALSEIVRGPFQACFLGYRIDALHEGRGYVGESIAAVLDHAFNVLNLHRVMANYEPSNERSGRVLRRAGFAIEGYARDYLFLNGIWRDHILASITNPDWAPKRSQHET